MRNLLLLLPLFLLLGGCGNEPANKYMLPAGAVNYRSLVVKEDQLWYRQKSDTLFSGNFYEMSGEEKLSEGSIKDGKMVSWAKYHLNGIKRSKQNWKDGKLEGLQTKWHGNGKKFVELEYKAGEELFAKYWNSKGKAVDSEAAAKD